MAKYTKSNTCVRCGTNMIFKSTTDSDVVSSAEVAEEIKEIMWTNDNEDIIKVLNNYKIERKR